MVGGGGGRSVHCAKASCNNIKHSRCASPPLNWSRDGAIAIDAGSWELVSLDNCEGEEAEFVGTC